MVVNCEDVWREISNYLDDDLAPTLRAAVEEHLRQCKRCTAVRDGARNVIQLYGDERMLEVPLGFSQRLHRRLEQNRLGGTEVRFGWMVAFAMAALVLVGFEVGHSFTPQLLRSEHARRGHHVPPDMMVVVAGDGKTYHVAGCSFIHDKTNLRTMTAAEAEREGYAPCVRCMKKYLTASAAIDPAHESQVAELADSGQTEQD